MIKSQRGFTFVELMITMVVFLLTITAAANIFSSLLNQFKQQSKIAETNIEGIVGLQMLRSDIEQAGYGLPYNLNGITYNEAFSSATPYSDPAAYNDATANPPRAVQVGNNIGFNNAAVTPGAQSDVLVIKATNLGLSSAATKWAYVSNRGALPNTIQPWNNVDGAAIPDENLENGDQVIVLNPIAGGTQRVLLSSGATFSTTFDSSAGTFASDFQPVASSFETYLIYGISPGAALRMPFNRADYYIRTPAAMPTRCAPNTGVLYKALLNHGATSAANQFLGSEHPLLDCVAAMQVLFGLDTNNDGAVESVVEDLGAGLTAENIRDQLKDIRVYILAQEGQRDTSYTSPSPITADDPVHGNVITFTIPAGDLRLNYRWKIYTLFIKPYDLR